MALTHFTPIYAGRSDGETEIRSKKHGKEFNGPSINQLDKVANPDDYYEPLDHDHPITIEWKRQLGGLLQREMRAQAEHPWFLMFFPENYRLYKHSKGTRDHTDAYLYGYPQGRKKRYRSAQEFFPHFQWLMEGKSEDYGDCACKNCAGDWVHKIEPLPGRDGFVPARREDLAIKKDAPPSRRESIPIKKESTQVKREGSLPAPKVVVQQRPSVQMSKPSAKTPTPMPITGAVARPPSQPGMTLIPLPLPASKEQELDAQYGKYTYRLGELVWFNRGTAWGLSLIIKRDTVKDPQGHGARPRARYLVQPLSHPFHHPEPKLMTSDDSLRPWLAWSAPGPTHKALAGRTFSMVDWKAVLAGQYGPGDAEVDGSIFAAKQVDESFTLLSPLSNNTTTTGERSYSAIFLGGEKLYVGEPARLRVNSGQDIMVIHQIIEKLKPNSTNINSASVHVIGNIYRLTVIPYDLANPKQSPNPTLPARMKADLEFRNSVTIPTKKIRSYWKQLQLSARLSIADLKGRWYESSILLPVLKGSSAFATDVQRGEITDIGEWINGRGDANGAAGKMGTRFRERLEALGRAVPAGLTLGGMDDAGEGGIEPLGTGSDVKGADIKGAQPSEVRGQDQTRPAGSRDGDLAEYMDLEKMDM
ncbi:MAG: hypothetical protein Q9163_004337 [Psora crenata]